MNLIRRKIIRGALLAILGGTGHYVYREQPDLFSHVSLEVTPAPTIAEYDEVLGYMEARNEIIRQRIDDELVAKITGNGELELAALRKRH